MGDEHSVGPFFPIHIREQIARAAPMYGNNQQQDAHEFTIEFLSQLHDALLREHSMRSGTGADAPN